MKNSRDSHSSRASRGDSLPRRDWLKAAGVGLGLTGVNSFLQRSGMAQEQVRAPEVSSSGEGRLRITDVKAILAQPANSRLAVVKVTTNVDGLYGVGCATFTQRIRLVEQAVNDYLRPFLIGKDPTRIEDIWQSNFVSSYWRNGPVLMNALSGVDAALWDILGKRAGLPLYQLLGGKARDGVDTYGHAGGSSFEAVEESVNRFREQGFRHVRVQVGVPGGYGARTAAEEQANEDDRGPVNARTRTYQHGPYARIVPKLFEYLREKLGDEIELLHDIHERLPPILAIQLCKDVEQYRPFFIEDPFAPEDVGYFKILRQQCATPIAMGELFNNPNEWVDIMANRLIDFIRCHVSQIGGLTMARKIAAFGEFFNVRTAWHGPGDTSPVGHAAQIHLGLATTNFGIQESRNFSESEREVFPGCPEIRNGYFYVSDEPGLGIDVDEAAAARYPIEDDPPFEMNWGNHRRPDGSIVKP